MDYSVHFPSTFHYSIAHRLHKCTLHSAVQGVVEPVDCNGDPSFDDMLDVYA